jgi:dienelactone hydrolase
MGGTPRGWCGVLVGVLVALLLCGAAPAHAQFVLEDAFPSIAKLGPAHAQGAVIWNHGKPPSRGADGDMLPFYLDRLRAAGWDIFKLERDWSSDDLELSPAALRDQVGALHDQGYRKLVLAGQSYGAWIALLVAASGPPIHAVIATAPAAFGRYPDSWIYRRNAYDLYPILEKVRNTRVMLFLFEGDAYDPGDRGRPARAILERNGVDSAVIAYPQGWKGHGAANWNGFATRFGPCIVRFVDPKLPADDAQCDRDPVTRGALRLELPDDVMRARAVSAGPLDDDVWYGVYGNGREALLALGPTHNGQVSATYGWGVQERDEVGAPGYERRIGRVEGDRVRFSEPGRPTLEVHSLGPDRLSLTWTSSDGTRSDSAELRPLR